MKTVQFKSQPITAENVRHIGESIAISAMKKLKIYAGNALDDLYRDLVHDIYSKNPDEPYTCGYDIASEVICFLCGYIGKDLADMICQDKHGNPICVRQASYKVAFRYIEKERFAIFNHRSIEDIAPHKLAVDFEETNIATTEEYDKVERIIAKMQLRDYELETLKCYMIGMTFVQIARYFGVQNSTIWRRRESIRKKYCKYVLCR